ncbi:hypothetical protein AruPA_15030, partial [Acidiphilium sp. PA]|uniref:hypothetical protein n=1 Tax=Acidiphilium sp. PA TaxID=2871705 RepID=UPI002243A034
PDLNPDIAITTNHTPRPSQTQKYNQQPNATNVSLPSLFTNLKEQNDGTYGPAEHFTVQQRHKTSPPM